MDSNLLEIEMPKHKHDVETNIPMEYVPIVLFGLTIFPIIWYKLHKKEVTII